MTPSRVVRAVSLFLLLAAIPSFAFAGTTQFRVLFDADSDSTTGCTIGSFPGAEQVLVTQVSGDDTTPAVTRTYRQVCTGGALGPQVDVVTTGWPAAWRSSDRALTLETRLPFLAFGSGTPDSVHVAFDVTRDAASHVALRNVDGSSFFIPAPPTRRRAVNPGPDRAITMDGQLLDWGGIKPLTLGIAGGGTGALRLLRVFSFADGSDSNVYFAAQVRIASENPFADDDHYVRDQGQGLEVPAPGVLANDGDPNGLPLTATKVSEPTHGNVTLNPDGSFTYSPTNPASKITDEFEYKATNGSRDSNVARVRINVDDGQGGDPPVDDSYKTDEDKTLNVPSPGVLSNDPGAPNLTATLQTPPAHGTVVLNADGGFTYKPTLNFFGTDTFVYTAIRTSNNKALGNATVTITVERVNDAPFFTPGGNVTRAANAGPYSATWATGISAGAPNESGQLLTFVVTNNNNALFTVQPAIAPNGTLTFTPAGTLGSATVAVFLQDNGGIANGGDNTSPTVTFTITITCGTITVTAPATTTATVGTAFSRTFTQTGGVGAVTFTTASALPAGLTLAANGTLSGTPTQSGTFPIACTTTDSNGCTGTANYALTVNCQTITVTNPATSTGTANIAFSQTFTQSGALGGATFTTASALPAGLTLATSGVLSGTPTQTGTFPIVVTVTDGNGCTGAGATYNLVIGCQTITVNNPGVTTATANTPFSVTFTASNTIGATTFTLASGTLPAGVTLAANGTLAGTPTQTGSFPITVRATDANGCTGTGATYTLVVGCQTVTVTNPATATGTAGAAFSQTFTASNTIGTTTFTLASGTLPTGLTLAANGTLSGTPTQTGSFPITVTATDANGCAGTGATYTIVIGCQTITVTNPSNTTGTVSSPFSVQFTQSGAIGGATFSTASTLPAGLTLSTSGLLSGTPTQNGTFPITVTVTDGNGCPGTSAMYTLIINCQTITVTNPANATGPAGSPFSETFTQTGGVGATTFTLASGVLPTGLTLNTNGTLSGTPTQGGSFPITVTATDGNGCTGTGATYNLLMTCPTITVTNPANANGTANSAFSETFTSSGGIGTMTYTLASGTLPAGLTLAANGTLSGTPTQTGSFPITVTATDANGCTGTSSTYTIVIACQTITVTNPVNANGTANSAFSETFTQTGGIGTTTFSLASGALPAGLTLAANGTLSGTPTATGSFPITVTATDANGCTGTSATYTIVIACQTITVTNPANANGTASSPFSETFTSSNTIGTVTYTLASGTLPAGLTLAANGVLSGTPTQTGSFPITVTATDANGCQGTGSTYTIVIACQTISVSNPANTAGTANAAFSETFTQTGAIGTATFTTASTLPAGLTLATNGVLSGTPTQTGSFPIVVTVTDSNGCTGTSATYTLVIACQTITVTNPATATGPAGSPFSATFTQSGAIGTATFTLASGTLPTGLTLASNGVLSGTPMQGGSFPITVTVTDSNGCTGTGSTYTLVITCPTITVNNPVNGNGTANSAFSETFTSSGGVGTMSYTLASGTLPAGLTLATTGVLSGTPTVTGSFPITVTATDQNGCTGTGTTYTIVIACQTITVNNPANANGVANSAFSETFTQTGGIGATNFTLASGTLPAGLTLAANGTLSGTPTVTGSFPITVTATDANGCTGTSTTYTIVIACQTINVTNPVNATGTAAAPFSETFTQTGAIGSATFTTASTLPAGLTLAANGVLSGTPTVVGTFPIVVTVTDSNGCTGTSSTYTLVIGCQTITVTNPANASGTVNAAFSETFTQTGAIGSASFSTASMLPAGLTLAANGTLSGTPTQSGNFPIIVTVTDGNGCTGTSSTYTLVIGCQTITVNNPTNTAGTAGAAFSETFTHTGGVGTVTFTTASTLPAGLTLATNGTLSGVPTSVGSFPITVTATDANGCTGTGATYTLVIGCQTITVTNPATNSVQAGQALSATFTATGILGTANWTLESGTLPTGITLNASTGALAGTTTQQGTFPITVRVTDTNGCFDISDTYTLTVTCPVITVTRTGGGSFPNATFNSAYAGQSFTASGGTGPYTFAVTSGTFPPGLTLASNGTISGTPTQTGTFNFTVTATDASLCTGSQSFSIAVAPSAGGDSFSNLVNNTQAVVTGGTTTSPSTPFVPLTGAIVANDAPAGGVSVVAGTFATTQAGSVTIAADGTFIYTPPVTASALASDTFNYTIASDTGSTGTPVQAIGTVTLNLAGRVWYVKNDGANGNGQSQSPFNSTSSFTNGARSGPDKPGDIIYIYRGDGTTTNLATGVVLLDNEQLIGEGVALVVNTFTLVPAGGVPQITNSTPGDVVTLGNGNTVRGLTITGGTNGITGTSKTAFTGGNLTLQNATGSGIVLTTFAGAVTLTNTTVSNNGIGVNLSGGTLTFTMDNSNSITANAGQRSINFATLGATAVATVGASITDNGLGISVANSVAGATVSFTGTQTLSTAGSTAVSLGTNTGATISFSGTLGITTTTGSGFVATGGGTLNVLGTANITTGAAVTSLNLNGMTIGGSGVAFNSVNATGPTTGINLVNNNGTVTVNGGTINNAGTGVNLQGATTSLSLANVTIGGTTTTGITNTTNFGTLTIGASVNVTATTALNLATGTVSGTFASVSSSGGTNGVNLNAVSGTWGTTGGALTGASGATFNVAGSATAGSQITWGGTITQNNAGTAVTISGHNRNITFNGNITTGGTSTGISIATSSGTYLFNATNTIAGSGGGITIGASESGTITFSNDSSISTAGSAFVVNGSGGAVTAAITYGGTITKSTTGVLISVDNLDSPGTLSMSHTPGAAGNISQSNNGANGISVINSSSTNITISDASVTFQNTAAGFTASGNSGTINLPGLALTGTGTKAGMLISGGGTINVNAGAANPSINLSAGTNAASKAIDGTAVAFSGTLNLTNVTISGNATAGADIVSLGGGTLGGSGSTITGANRALVLSSVALTNGAGLSSVTSTGGANGISLTNVTGGPYTIGGGSLTLNTGASFLVSGGSRTITYAGTMTQSTAGQRVIDIQSSTGGTINFTGAVTSTGAGIFANSNANTGLSFRGGVSLTTTTNAAFTATAGGGTSTLEVCDENPCNAGATGALVNTITTTTGVALNVANTDITANNLEFRSINAGTGASGPANGIILNTTDAAGGLKVKGTGAAGTGGTIQRTTGDAISLTSTQKVSLSFMNVQNSAESGILGTTVTDLNLATCNFTNNGDDSADEGIKVSNLAGTATWTDLSVTGSAHNNVFIDNTSGTLTSFTVSGNSHFDSVGAAFGANAVLLDIRGTSVLTAGSISGATFQNNKPARGVTVQAQDTATITSMIVQNGVFTNNGLHASFEQSGSANLTFRFQNNGTAVAPMTMPNTAVGTSHALNVFSSSTSTGGSINGRVTGNFVGNSAVAGSGSAIGNGLRVFIQGKTVATLLIDGNVMRQIPQARGIDIQLVGQLTAAQPIVQHDITVTNNDVNPQDSTGFPATAIYLAADNQGSPARLRSDVRGNTVPAGAAVDVFPTFIAIDEVVASAEAQLVDTAPASANCTAQLTSTNTGSASAAAGCVLIAGPINTPP